MMQSQWLAHISGDTQGIRKLAVALDASATRLSAIGRALNHLKSQTSWESPAGVRFGAQVQQVPVQLERLARRYTEAASAVGEFAPILEDTQRQVSAVIEEHFRVRRRADDLLSSLEGTEDELTTQRVLEQHRAAVTRCNELEAIYRRGWNTYTTADRRCASRLSAIADDALDDPWHYSAAVWVGERGRELGQVPPWGPLAALTLTGDIGAVGSDLALYAFYDEGSIGEMTLNALSYAVPVGGQALRRTAASGVRIEASKTSRTIAGDPSWSVKDNARNGVWDALRERNLITRWMLNPSDQRVHLPALPKPARPVLKGLTNPQRARALRDYAKASGVQRLERAFLKDFKMATANGATARQLYYSGVVMERGQQVVGVTQTVAERAPEVVDAIRQRGDQPGGDRGATSADARCQLPPGGVPGAGLP